MNSNSKKYGVSSFLFYMLVGMLVGVGGVIPGLSGGVMCAIFGIYQPLMDVLSNPIKNLKKHWKLLLPVVIGIVIGFLALAKAVLFLFDSNEEIAVCLFVGLILGMLPSLFKEAGEKGRFRSSYISMGIAFAVLFGFFMFLNFAAETHVTPNNGWYAFCGACWAIGLIVPGMSASSPLLFLGLYDPLLEIIETFPHNALAFVKGDAGFSSALSEMAWIEAICFGAGLLGIIVLCARPVNYLLKRFPSQMYHAIFGIVLATTLPIIPYRFDSVKDFAIKIGVMIIGFIAAFGMDKLTKRFAPEDFEG